MKGRARNHLAILLTAIAALASALLALPARGQTFKVLHTFQGGPGDGATPAGKLIMDSSGNLYGLTEYGGAQTLGWGTIFKVDSTTWKETVLYRFSGGADGGYAFGGLVFDSAGNLYGTTAEGGSSNCSDGCGVVFKFATTGKETVLYAFLGGNDGAD